MIRYKEKAKLVRDFQTYRSHTSLKISSTLSSAIYLMNSMEVEAAGVTDDYNHCIGFLTGDDLVHHIYDTRSYIRKPFVGDIMKAPSMAVYWDESAAKALNIMNMHQIDWLPVINYDSNEFEALLCRGDIVGLETNILKFSRNGITYQNTLNTQKN